MAFVVSDGANAVTVDYPLPDNDKEPEGMTPLRLLLASLAGCSGSTVAFLLRRDGQAVERVEVTARGERREEHPTVLTSINLQFTVHGTVDPTRVEQVLRLAEEKICPVWAMLKTATPVSSGFTVVSNT